MKKLLNKYKSKAVILIIALVTLGLMNACTQDELPGAGSFDDKIPPGASFSYAADTVITIINFTNLSTEAVSYEWDFGVDGVEVPDSVRTAIDPTYTYPSIGTYEVTLTAIDGLNTMIDTTISVVVAEGPFQPIILEAEFEGDGDTGDARDPWASEFTSRIEITSDGAPNEDDQSTKGGKLGADGSRVAYQEITVEEGIVYNLSFAYDLEDNEPGSIVVEILDVDANGGAFESYESTRDHVIGAVTLNNQEDPGTYAGGEISFSSGTSEHVAIMVSNTGVDARFDNFAIVIGNAGVVTPSASFTAIQSVGGGDAYLEYTFENSSLNGDTYAWDFGDDNTSTLESPVYKYEEAGTYTVNLVVTRVTIEGGLRAEFTTEIIIHDPVEADFGYTEGASSFIYSFEDQSTNAVSVLWEFGDGYQFTSEDANTTVEHEYENVGYYEVTLTATSSTGLESVKTETLAVGIPTVFGGNFEDTSTGDDREFWTPASYSLGGSTTPYGGSGNGAFQSYDGTDTDEKTRGAKIDASKAAQADGSQTDTETRYAYQELTLAAGDYYLEFSYDSSDGDIVAGEILDGHFDDGSNALAASLDGSSLVEIKGTLLNGEESGGSDDSQWRTIRGKFTAPASGEIAIWMWASGGESYYDNVKILPAFLVEG